jgi:rubrerythrin
MASMFFNEVEAARIAQNMEANGRAFYERFAAKTKSPRVRDLFLQLADDEKKHLAAFEELEATLQSRPGDTAENADDPDLGVYIERLLQTQVFSDSGDVARRADQAKDDGEALAVGMKAERDSIVFYQEMIDFVDTKVAREAFAWILKEERRHLRLLGDRAADFPGTTS